MNSAAAIAAPVDPTDTVASARPSRTSRAATRTVASRRERTARTGSSSMPMPLRWRPRRCSRYAPEAYRLAAGSRYPRADSSSRASAGGPTSSSSKIRPAVGGQHRTVDDDLQGRRRRRADRRRYAGRTPNLRRRAPAGRRSDRRSGTPCVRRRSRARGGTSPAAGAVAFHWLRREWVLDREVRRLGTATSGLLFWTGLGRLRLVAQSGQGRPPWVDRIVRMVFGKISEPLAAVGAQAGAVVDCRAGSSGSSSTSGIAQQRLEIDQIVDELGQLVVVVPAMPAGWRRAPYGPGSG